MRYFVSIFIILAALTARAQDIVFADTLVRRLCVERWDADGDGRLSQGEAAEVRSLDGAFFRLLKESPVSFDELRYFTSLRLLGPNAFTDCYNLRTISLPPRLEVIDSHAFWSCTELESIILPPTVRTLETQCFYHCSALKAITTPPSVRDSIPFEAFAWCTSMREATISDGPTIIGPLAFFDCRKLHMVTLPATIRKICINAFRDEVYLRRLCVLATEPPVCEEDVFSPYILENTMLYVPAGTSEAYRKAPIWRDFRYIVELIE